MFKRIDHVEIVPVDFEKTYKFYTEVLGFKEKSRMKMDRPPMQEIVFAELSDSVIEFLRLDNPSPGAEGVMHAGYLRIALEVEDMDEAVAYLKENGVTISREPMDLGSSKRGEILDPDGLSIELRQWK
jgi:catechol 2,3-dioxygenase-like lactoylglutathione lyase family enzyme|tara:strand:+ start:227 stop:610 length:384 start_codon:yes stop_codon:yes gene_type:complete